LQELDAVVRDVFKAHDGIQCHAFMTASYCKFKHECWQYIKHFNFTQSDQIQSHIQAEVVLGQGYSARLTHTHVLVAYRPRKFNLPKIESKKRKFDVE